MKMNADKAHISERGCSGKIMRQTLLESFLVTPAVKVEHTGEQLPS